MEFEKWPSIPRLKREMTVTEKLDGTNAQVTLVPEDYIADASMVARKGGFKIFAGSRKRWITLGDDNYGFARWVHENADQLVELGEGSHYGEWWGKGIQRGYDLDEKRFSLFNTGRWDEDNTPDCVSVVPVLHTGEFNTEDIDEVMDSLKVYGSVASPGFRNPEGVAIFHTHSNTYFKYTFEHDASGKPFGA